MAEHPVELEFTYTREIAVQASAEMTRILMPFLRVMPIIGACVLASQMIYTRGVQLVFPIFVGLLLIGMPLYIRWAAVRTFKTMPNANKSVRWVIGPEELSVESSIGTSRFTWAGIIRARETRHGFLLFTHPRIAHWLPRSAFKSADDLQRVLAWIRARGIPTNPARAAGMSLQLKLILWAIITAVIAALYFYEPRSHRAPPEQPSGPEN